MSNMTNPASATRRALAATLAALIAAPFASAQTDAETPCDLSAALASVVGGATFRTGAFIGFGSDNNAGSKVTVFGRVVARSGAKARGGLGVGRHAGSPMRAAKRTASSG